MILLLIYDFYILFSNPLYPSPPIMGFSYPCRILASVFAAPVFNPPLSSIVLSQTFFFPLPVLCVPLFAAFSFSAFRMLSNS